MVVVQLGRMAVVRQRVEQVTRLAERGEHLRLRAQRLGQAVQQRDATFEADQRVVEADLEHLGQHARVERGQRLGIDAQRIARVGREAPGHEGAKAGHRQSFGARERLPALALAVAPVGCRRRRRAAR